MLIPNVFSGVLSDNYAHELVKLYLWIYFLFPRYTNWFLLLIRCNLIYGYELDIDSVIVCLFSDTINYLNLICYISNQISTALF